jgi:organic hydroperoxide reductase OsmC/OhrA
VSGVPTRAKVFEYAVDVDRGGRMTNPGGAQIAPAEGWTPDHMLLAALVRCSIESLRFHARRAGREVAASGEAHGLVTKREPDGRYAFVQIAVRIDAQLTPRADETTELVANAERDCFVSASLALKPEYEWHVS